MEKYAIKICKGGYTGNNDRYIRNWYEVSIDSKNWHKYSKGGPFRKWYGNSEFVVYWKDNGVELKNNESAGFGASKYYDKEHFVWSGIGTGLPSFRYDPKDVYFDDVSPSVVFDDKVPEELLALMNSKISYQVLELLAPTQHFQAGDIKSVPVKDKLFLASSDIKERVNINILISKQDWDSHETSWDFKTNELFRFALGLSFDQLDSLAMYDVCRSLNLELLVSQYKEYWKQQFMQLHTNEEEINRKVIEIYELQEELTPDVPLNEVTILQKGEMNIIDDQIEWHDEVIIKQFISYLIGCFLGRYSVDKPGLIIASQGQKLADLDLPAQTLEIDDDGIIPVVLEEDFFADDMTQRIEAAVKTLFGEDNFYENMKYIKDNLGMSLRDYLYKNFYADHLQMYSVKGAKRPIYWLFSSQMGDKKKKGYFKALIYMHRMEADTLSKLHADYVHPYIKKIEQQLVEAEDNATRDNLSQAQHNKALKLAEELREKVREVKNLEKTLVEMASARITINLDDGVKTNYPKFYPLVEPIKGLELSEE